MHADTARGPRQRGRKRSLVLSRLDYCTLLSGMPQQLIDKLQEVQNCPARLIFKTSKRTHVSPLLAKLHWLSVTQRIEYKVHSTSCDVVWKAAPPYLSHLLHPHIPSRPFRSSAHTSALRIPIRKKKTPRTTRFLPSSEINSPTLYAMLQNSSSSKLNSEPHYCIPLRPRTTLLRSFVSKASHTPPVSR